MVEEIMPFDLPKNKSSIIKVIGVGGGGGNAVNHMCELGIRDVDFAVCNTDGQALEKSPVPVKIQLGSSLTEGRGAGNKPEVGKQAAIENLDDVIEILSHNTKMVFITAGMGGGTGTGAAPVIAKAAKELGILTVAIVTIPFRYEGQRRINQAIEGLAEIEQHVDSLLVINNEKIREMYGDLKLSEAFSKADDVLAIAAKGIAEIITLPGYINVDFADVETVMQNSGVAIMGSAYAQDDDRAMKAVKEALSSPLLNNNDIKGAQNILLNITSGNSEITMDEISDINDYVQDLAGDADLIWGNGTDDNLGDSICVTVIATGFEASSIPELFARKKQKNKVSLEEQREMKSSLKKQPNNIQTKGDFQVKDASQHEDEKEAKDEFMVSQRTIEFDLRAERENDMANEYIQSREKNNKTAKNKDENKLHSIKKAQETYKELRYKTPDNKLNIDELENEPAYIRRQVNVQNDVKHSQELKISKFTLEDDEDEDEESGRKVRLSDRNPYLHDNVD
ncbi:MAG: cell division protein FtsZ [Bacteroidetes bacterium]|jgi:cell division protein FtsZ|nr:cell division protein FtsZ [Bacteroidota bacterium]